MQFTIQNVMATPVYPKSKELLGALLKEGAISKYLSLLREHHLETYQHSIRVGLLCLDMGLELNLTPVELRLLGHSGVLHDIGKRRIPKRVLSKSAPLNPTEKEVMRGHPRLSFLELDNTEYEIVRAVVVTHHEFKVNPYPRGGADRRKGRHKRAERRSRSDFVEALGQIVAVADIFDALASRRAYKPPLPKEEIGEVLREQFTGDEHLVKMILRRV